VLLLMLGMDVSLFSASRFCRTLLQNVKHEGYDEDRELVEAGNRFCTTLTFTKCGICLNEINKHVKIT